MNKKRVIIISCLTILACLMIICGSTFALFTKNVTTTQHLQAGHLDLTLQREKLVTNKLQENGTMKEETNNQLIDFTKSTNENLFGIKEIDKVVPGSSYEATLILKNLGDVAIDYYIEIVIKNGEETELIKQLQLTFIDIKTNTTKSNLLSNGLQMGSETESIGQVLKNESTKFQVKLMFLNQENVNNDAFDQEVEFDLIVHATQSI